jgi:hypothetical protein
MATNIDDLLEQQDEDATLVAWELLMLSRLGFTLAQSETILGSNSSWHDALSLLNAGCSQHLATRILS